jgi:predicted MPP superfamily phosphohydrolase
MNGFVVLSLAGWAVVVLLAAALRSRAYAVFRAVTLGVHTGLAIAVAPTFAPVEPLFWALHATVYVHSLALVRPRMRSLAYRALVSLPAAFFAAGTLLALPWVVLAAFGADLRLSLVGYGLAAFGLLQSFWTRPEVVDVVVADGRHTGALTRHPVGPERSERPLRLVQITDPHLGPFMSVSRLRGICARAVEHAPDLVVLTGDFLTMESQGDPNLLAEALQPLRALPGRVFACLGNHDHEAPETVRRALHANGVRLLVDEADRVETEAGPVQIVGFDFAWTKRAERMQAVCERYPREPGTLRLVLLHDPSAFKHLPEGHADLVLSGHTHGGQVGLLSLGLPWTMLRVFMNAPDHGLWARGTDRLYVHRGTGHYGFPLRLGVPAEESLLRVHVGSSPSA